MPRYVLALDQGTTSSRALVFREDGSIAGAAQQEFPQLFPRAGWVEHDPEAIWSSQLAAARDALAAADVAASEVAAIGIANQRETVVMWERATLAPVANAIVWQDRRTAPDCDRLAADGLAAVVYERTGLVLDAYFSGTKIAWLLRERPELRARAERGELAVGTVDSWLLARLTGGAAHVTDRTNAARTMLYNIDALAWDAQMLSFLDIPPAMLPQVHPSGSRFGVTSGEHFGAEVPVSGVAGDQQAATFGQGCVAPGQAKNTYGTGCFLLMVIDGRPVRATAGMLTTLTAASGDAHPGYALEGSIFVAGAAVQWLRDGLQIIGTAAESEALAASVASSDGVYVIPAFVGLGAPYWDQYARGTIVGLTRGSTRAHIARATLESIAFQTRDVVEAMASATGAPLHELRVDGGASANDLLMQMQADILGCDVIRPQSTETTAFGAALLAGVTEGIWTERELGALRDGRTRRFSPRIAPSERERRYAGWRRAVERSRGWADV